jgi:signal transduction histidine kinase
MLSHLEHAVETERESNQRMRSFLADASHELRTPLTAVRGYAELKRRGGLADRAAEDRAWQRIESEGDRMGTLVEDLLAITRLDEGQPLEFTKVDVARLAVDAAADHAVIDPSRPIEVETPAKAVVFGDQNRLAQVIANLLSNARVHTPEGTSIRVEVADGDDHVTLTVTDDGPGIPNGSLDSVFERFHRGDASRSRASGGNGLGLAIVESIVAAHGGTVTARNRTGGGAQFTLTLPK